jgi:hypothetical protein
MKMTRTIPNEETLQQFLQLSMKEKHLPSALILLGTLLQNIKQTN